MINRQPREADNLFPAENWTTITVDAKYGINGGPVPITLQMEGYSWSVQEILRQEVAASRKKHHTGTRYLILIGRQELNIYFDRGLWYITHIDQGQLLDSVMWAEGPAFSEGAL